MLSDKSQRLQGGLHVFMTPNDRVERPTTGHLAARDAAHNVPWTAPTRC
jgi:hypothetical protein